ncbi:MAG: hypothetical protein EOP09_18030, partial [Proteobacteria bacterium]
MTPSKIFLATGVLILGFTLLFIARGFAVSEIFQAEGEISLPWISLSLANAVESKGRVIFKNPAKGLRLEFDAPNTQTNFYREHGC